MNGPHHSDWENDPVWNLIDEAKTPEAGPFFVRNVMREVRLSEERPSLWWRFLGVRPLLASALGAAAAVVIIANLNSGDPAQPGLAEKPATLPPTPSAPALDELVEEEILYQAAEDPSAFSDEALVALLY